MRRKYLPTVSRMHLKNSARELIISTCIVQLSPSTPHLVACRRKARDLCPPASGIDAVGMTFAWVFTITCHFKKQRIDWRDVGICSLVSIKAETSPAGVVGGYVSYPWHDCKGLISASPAPYGIWDSHSADCPTSSPPRRTAYSSPTPSPVRRL
jgi:hypothetical protein